MDDIWNLHDFYLALVILPLELCYFFTTLNLFSFDNVLWNI